MHSLLTLTNKRRCAISNQFVIFCHFHFVVILVTLIVYLYDDTHIMGITLIH